MGGYYSGVYFFLQEGGLLGSQAVAKAYAAQGLEVYGMSQVCSQILCIILCSLFLV